MEAVDYVIPASVTDASNATGAPAAMVAFVLDASAPPAALEALQAAMLQALPSTASGCPEEGGIEEFQAKPTISG